MKLGTLVAGALLMCATTAYAQQPEAQLPAADQAMMEAMIKAGTPGDHHKQLEAFVGTWDTKITILTSPDAEPMITRGKSENRFVMGGRYLEQRFSGDFGGMPFEGLGYTGYDNIKKRYWGTWMDNMSTSMMTSTGQMSADGKSFTFTGTMPDPIHGEMPVDETITIVDADHHLMEMWTPGPDGKKFKSMTIAYSRSE